MFSYLYSTFIYKPLYNGLIGIIDILPNALDAGIAVILFTIIVKAILAPLSKKAILYQVRMKKLQPQLSELQAKYKHDKQLQTLKIMEFYKQNKISPFATILPILIQLPIIIGLYSVFTRSGLPEVDTAILYPFVAAPEINVYFLGILDITQKSIVMAILAAVSQYLYFKVTMPPPPPSTKKFGDAPNFQEDLQRSMSVQMKYIFPVVIFFMAYKLSAVVALYWIVNNLFTLAQDYWVKRNYAIESNRSSTN
ncbi:MAG: YidC/Oxa1 family membrane protein insertase [Patescibacteria group bacterium]